MSEFKFVSPTLSVTTIDSECYGNFRGDVYSARQSMIKISVNLPRYLHNLLYYDRGCKILQDPPCEFTEAPTENLLLQIISQYQSCLNEAEDIVIDVKRANLERIVNLLLGYNVGVVTATEINNTLTDLVYLVFPDVFYTSLDCKLNVKLNCGPDRYYGITRAFHSLGSRMMETLVGKYLEFDCNNWIRLGSRAQYIATLECVKIQGDQIIVTDGPKYRQAFNSSASASSSNEKHSKSSDNNQQNYVDKIYRDRLILYIAFINWCVNNKWGDNLLAFIYTGYRNSSILTGYAPTLEVVEKSRVAGSAGSGAPCGGTATNRCGNLSTCRTSCKCQGANRGEQYETSQFCGYVLRMLHSEDCLREVTPSDCPPSYVSRVEGNRALTDNRSNSGCDDFTGGSNATIGLYVPLSYWNFIIDLQIKGFPHGHKQTDVGPAKCRYVECGPVSINKREKCHQPDLSQCHSSLSSQNSSILSQEYSSDAYYTYSGTDPSSSSQSRVEHKPNPKPKPKPKCYNDHYTDTNTSSDLKSTPKTSSRQIQNPVHLPVQATFKPVFHHQDTHRANGKGKGSDGGSAPTTRAPSPVKRGSQQTRTSNSKSRQSPLSNIVDRYDRSDGTSTSQDTSTILSHCSACPCINCTKSNSNANVSQTSSGTQSQSTDSQSSTNSQLRLKSSQVCLTESDSSESHSNSNEDTSIVSLTDDSLSDYQDRTE